MKEKTPRIYHRNDTIVNLFVSKGYDFRYNIISRKVEMILRKKMTDPYIDIVKATKILEGNNDNPVVPMKVKEWFAIEDEDLLHLSGQIAIDLYNEKKPEEQPQHIELTKKNRVIDAILSYAFQRRYNPIEAYFEKAKKEYEQTQTSVFNEFWSLIQIQPDHEAHYRDIFVSWMQGIIVTAMKPEEEFQNFVLILAGDQGTGKTTFLLNMFKDLRPQYVHSGNPQKYDKEHAQKLSKNILWLMDEIPMAENTSYIDMLKGLITQATSEVRVAYGKLDKTMVRRASFAATTNRVAFLNDATGDRRFVGIGIELMDSWGLRDMNLRLLWGQVYSELEANDFKVIDISKQREIHNEKFKGEDPLLSAVEELVERTENDSDHVLLKDLVAYLSNYRVAILAPGKKAQNEVIRAMHDVLKAKKSKYLIGFTKDNKKKYKNAVGFRGCRWTEEGEVRQIVPTLYTTPIPHLTPVPEDTSDPFESKVE